MNFLSINISKKVILFILFSFLISWGVWLIMLLSKINLDSFASSAIIACFYMQGPILSVLIVQKIIYKEPFLKYGFSFKGNSYKWMLSTPLIFLLFIFIYILLCLALGNLFSIKGFGHLDFSFSSFINKIEEISGKAPEIPNLPEAMGGVLFSIGILFSTIFAGFINLPFTLGEEYGWRGLLFEELKNIGFIQVNLIIGFVWGLWHAPLILYGHNYPKHPYIGVLFMILFCTSLSFLFSYLKIKYNNVFAPAMFHGILNGTAGIFIYFLHDSNELIGSIVGINGVFASFITFMIISKIKKKDFLTVKAHS